MSHQKIRITIEIEDGNVTATTVDGTTRQETIPPELAHAAAAAGAISAGPAPTHADVGQSRPEARAAPDVGQPPEPAAGAS